MFQSPMMRVKEKSSKLNDVSSLKKGMDYFDDEKSSIGVFLII